MYLLAIFLPPVAVLACGKPIQALLALFLSCFLVAPGSIYAILVVNQYLHEQNTNRIVGAIKSGNRNRAGQTAARDDNNPFAIDD